MAAVQRRRKMKKLKKKIKLYKELIIATAEATDAILICLMQYTNRTAIFAAHSVHIESLLYKIKKEENNEDK